MLVRDGSGSKSFHQRAEPAKSFQGGNGLIKKLDSLFYPFIGGCHWFPRSGSLWNFTRGAPHRGEGHCDLREKIVEWGLGNSNKGGDVHVG